MFSLEKFINQNLKDVWYSRTFHASGSSSFSIKHDGACGFLIHGITLKFANTNSNTIKINVDDIMITNGAVSIPFTHVIYHVIMDNTLTITCTEATTLITIHYQYLSPNGGKIK